jgi:Skp family chaperone for outer membrane proteins
MISMPKSIRWASTAVLVCLLAVSAGAARAETYHWVDSQGTMQFSDNPASVPPSQRAMVRVTDDITTSNPEVRASLAESRNRAAAIEREDRDKARQRRVREARDEQEHRIREVQEKRAHAEQLKREQQSAAEQRGRLSTAPIQTAGVGGFSAVRSGST